MKNITDELIKVMDPLFIGYGNYYNRITQLHNDLVKNSSNYPPYNIKIYDDNKFILEIAVAGFTENELDIVRENNKLIVKGQKDEDTSKYLHKGIAARAFTRTFIVDENVEVKGASLNNGMLIINFEQIIPESKKPKKININSKSETQFLSG